MFDCKLCSHGKRFTGKSWFNMKDFTLFTVPSQNSYQSFHIDIVFESYISFELICKPKDWLVFTTIIFSVSTKDSEDNKERQGSWENNWTCWTTASAVCSVPYFRKGFFFFPPQQITHSYNRRLTLWDVDFQTEPNCFQQQRHASVRCGK